MDNPLVSIIIPVYNAEKYLRRCLDSIINQTYQDIEVILVDDGSKDTSGSICDEYAAKDLRIKVVHEENRGVSSTRQTGLMNSKGIFVIHVDPDDWIESNMIQELLNKAVQDNVDIVMCDFMKEFSTNHSLFSQKPTSLERDDLLMDLLYNKIWGSCCNKLIRRECFEKYNISFIPEMSLWEDLFVITALVYNGASLSYLALPLYHYDCYSNPESITRIPNINQINSVKLYIDYFEKLLQDNKYKEGFYLRKLRLKARCFRMGKKYKEIFNNLFPEINQRFILENRFKLNEIRAYRGDIYKMEQVCMALNLKYNTDFGYSLYDFWKKYATRSFRSLLK